jgi:hypothetical protein
LKFKNPQKNSSREPLHESFKSRRLKVKEAGVKKIVGGDLMSDDNEVYDGDGSYVLAIQSYT